VDPASLIGPDASLWSLAAASFLAATLLPMSSEVALFAVLKVHPHLFWPAIGVATAANTLGGMTTYLVGRFLATRKPLKHVEAVERWGPAALLLAWAPLVGDALCVAAGWLKLNWMASAAFQALGRAARYVLVAQGAAL
jgi:membrane protein YqaA with SNARE-associated domain